MGRRRGAAEAVGQATVACRGTKEPHGNLRVLKLSHSFKKRPCCVGTGSGVGCTESLIANGGSEQIKVLGNAKTAVWPSPQLGREVRHQLLRVRLPDRDQFTFVQVQRQTKVGSSMVKAEQCRRHCSSVTGQDPVVKVEDRQVQHALEFLG